MNAQSLQAPRTVTLSSRSVIAVMLGAIACAVLGVAVATYMDLITLGIAASAGLLLLLAGLRWPLLPLCVYVAVIPIDDVVYLGDFGSLGRTAAIIFTISYVLPRIGRLKLNAMPIAGWAFLGWAILSIGWSLDADLALREIATIVQMFVIALLIADVTVDQPGRVRLLLWVYSIAAALTAAIGIANYLAGQVVEGERAAALAQQSPAHFAAILLPAFLFGLHELLAGRLKLLSGAVVLVSGVAIVLAGTRGVWLGAMFVTGIFVIPRLRRGQQVVALGLLAAVLVLVMQIPGAGDLITQRAGNAISSGGSGRTGIWTVGLGIIESSPIVGVGYANFPVAYTPEMIRETVAGDLTDVGRAPHNIVIGTLGELGAIGLIMLAMFLGPLLLRRGWGPYGAAVQAILASLMVSALFLDMLGNRKHVWFVIGLAAGLTYVRQHRARSSRDVDDVVRPDRLEPG